MRPFRDTPPGDGIFRGWSYIAQYLLINQFEEIVVSGGATN